MDISFITTNQSAFIPIKIISETTWTQFIIPLVVSSIFILYFVYTLLKESITSPLTYLQLFRFRKLRNKPIMLIRHNNDGLFNTDMIERKMFSKINKLLNKFKGKSFDLILHTPGGDVFATLFLSKLLKTYPGKIDVFIPQYAMSGGSLLALSCANLHMNKYSCIGVIDPQLGDLFHYGSAASWKDVMKIKKGKVEDRSIIFNRLGKQVENTIRKTVYDLVKTKSTQPIKFTKLLVDGNVEHIYQIDPYKLKEYGVDVLKISDKEKVILDKVISIKNGENIGVYGVK